MTITVVVEPAVAIATSLGAALLGGWMTFRGLGSAGLPGCGIGSVCDAVTRGRWSRIGIIPVALLGTIVYLALTAFAIARFEFLDQINFGWRSPAAMLPLVVFGAAAWFMLLQLLVIRRLCIYCTATHLLACTAAGLLLTAHRPWLDLAWKWELPLAIACVVMLAISQILIKPRTFIVTKILPQPPELLPENAEFKPAASSSSSTPAPAVIQSNVVTEPTLSNEQKPFKQRRVRLLSGNVVLNVDGWPLLGRSDAQNVVAVLFDFTCKECHQLRKLLEAAVAARPDWLAVALVPVPLNSNCNPAITCKDDGRAQACDYARLAWAVWLANDQAYGEWDRFLNAEPEVQPYGLALIRAKELADLKRFRLQDADPLLDRAVGTGVGLYQATGKPTLPAILLPSTVVNGHLNDLATLFRLLDTSLPRAARSVPDN